MLHEHRQKVLDLIEESRNYPGLPNSGLYKHLSEIHTHMVQLACPHSKTVVLDWPNHTGHDITVLHCPACDLVTIKTDGDV